MAPAPKVCASCGRPFEWRRAWADVWDEVRYCSKACRRHRPNATDRALEAALLDALRTRREVPTDDAAKAIGGPEWESLTERARRAARRLAAEGTVVLVQRGKQVDANAKGAFSLRRTSTPYQAPAKDDYNRKPTTDH